MSFKNNGMRTFEVDDYYTIVAHNEEEARKLHIEINEADPEEIYVMEIDAEKSMMFVSINDIPAERVKELLSHGSEAREYGGDTLIPITKAEAMKYRSATEPYILSVSSVLL